MRALLRSTVRSAFVGILAILATVVLAVTTTLGAAITLAATTALIVPGTGTPNPGNVGLYEDNARDYYIETTTGLCQPSCATQGVPYIAQFWPFPFPGWGGLSGARWNVSVGSGVAQLTSDLIGTYNPTPATPVVVFGYSQGSTVASLVKRNLSQLSDPQKANLAFVLIGNPNRPNGGVFERLALLGTVPILDATFGQPTPTDTGIHTTDIAFQYDGVSDFPEYPINLLADLNAIAGFAYIHGTYLAPNQNSSPGELPNGLDPTDLENTVTDIVANCATDPRCQQHGDTTYVTIPTPNLPILQPLRDLGAATHTQFITTPLIDLIQPVLRVLIETGYDRSNYGQPTPFRLIPRINPITLTVDLVAAVGQGIHDALNDIGVSLPVAATPVPAPTTLAATTLAATSTSNAVTTPTAKRSSSKPVVSPAAAENSGPTAGDDSTETPKATAQADSTASGSITKITRPKARGPIGSQQTKIGDENSVSSLLPKPKKHVDGDGTGADRTSDPKPEADAA